MAKIAAVLLGVILAFVLLSSIFSDTSSATGFAREMFVRLGIVAALYAAFGVAFGLFIPRLAWRWGLWLNVPAFLLLSLFTLSYVSSIAAGDVVFGRVQDWAEALLLFGFFAGALVGVCLGAYAGARARHHLSSE
ncbi:MAG: hypothetical protein H0T57_03965 [Rubrobacter sp.]|nr:hypothetical protein [Rubrobacter sp.]